MKAVVSVVLLAFVIGVYGYGEPDSNGHPTWQERANHVFLNAVRLSPSGYKNVYMAGYSPSPSSILVNYPAVNPVYLINQLDASAFGHSNEMATKNYFAHNSYDGTDPFTRIRASYSCSGTMGENIAAGYADPLATSNQWLCDQSGSACAADKSGSDGHRSNMMGSGYQAVGVGFAYGSSAQYKNYWTQDFGGSACSPAPTSPIYGGSHRVASGNNKFIAIFSGSAAPASASVVINGVSNTLTFEIGTTAKGVYVFSQAAGTACRSYYFVFVDSAGKTWRYPDTGCLVTYGEGSCTTSFDAACGGVTTTTMAPTTTTTTAPTTTTTTMAPTTTTTTMAPTTTTTTAPTTTTTTTAPTSTTTTTMAPTTTTTTTMAPTTTTTTMAPTTTTTTRAPTTTTTTKAPSTTAAPVDWMSTILNAHNTARAAVGLKPLVWNDSAAAVAQKYAAQCTFAHNSNRGPYGENIYANAPGATQPSTSLASAGVQSWVDEKKNFNCAANTCASGQTCGHYTQVTWSATTSVGCGLVKCTTNSPFGSNFPTWNFMVCDYAPPGNYVGQKPYSC